MAEYPVRDSHYAHKFVRLLLRVCACQEIGSEGFALLVAIAHTEDAKRYRAPVTYWNDQLSAILGITSRKQLGRVRDKCVAAGWLHYERESTRHVGYYWTTIPARFEGLDDADVSCDAHLLTSTCVINVPRMSQEWVQECPKNGYKNVPPSYPAPTPIPVPVPGPAPPKRPSPRQIRAADLPPDRLPRWTDLAAVTIASTSSASPHRNGRHAQTLAGIEPDVVARWWVEHIGTARPLTGDTALDLAIVLCCATEVRLAGRAVANKLGLLVERLASGEWAQARVGWEDAVAWIERAGQAGTLTKAPPKPTTTHQDASQATLAASAPLPPRKTTGAHRARPATRQTP